MKLSEFLLRHTNVGDLVIFLDDGWQIGCTIIDHEDLFLGSLNTGLLTRKVKSNRYEKKDWTSKPVMVVELN
nr:MAG TPA: hypothetical protein [Caudoviricetes sp.]